MSLPPSNSRKIALIGFEGVQSLDLVGPLEAFSMANIFGAAVPYEVLLASPGGGEIIASSGLKFAGTIALQDVPEDIDTFLVAGGELEFLGAMQVPAVHDWLRERARITRRVCSIGSGTLILAATGLLDGRRATIHWRGWDALPRLRPQVKLEPDAIFVADPPFYTSAGVTAGIDLCLALVEADCGPEVALAVARKMILFMRRPGGQTQYSAGLQMQAAATPRMRTLITDITSDPTGDLSLAELADRTGMSLRTFSRAFHKETGVTPGAFVELARVDRAKALLESSDWPLARVAERSGFTTLHALHRSFRKRVGITPGEYRERFGSEARAIHAD